jgi:anti-sigma regulatory factor (Ser/Thr protein kinase)
MGITESGSDVSVGLTEARAALETASHRSGALSGQLVIGSLDDPIWQPLPAESANPVRVARTYVASLLAEVATTDGGHVDDVVLAVSELVTNAIRHATGEGHLSVRLAIRPRWTHLYVADPDPTVPTLAPGVDDDLALSGRGVPIVGELGLLWFVAEDHGKTAHAVIMRTDEKLTDDEHDALMRLAIARHPDRSHLRRRPFREDRRTNSRQAHPRRSLHRTRHLPLDLLRQARQAPGTAMHHPPQRQSPQPPSRTRPLARRARGRRLMQDITYDVRIYKTHVYKGKKVTTYYVRWKTGGKSWKEPYRSAAQADSFRSSLIRPRETARRSA